jgi:hypothetical protein
MFSYEPLDPSVDSLRLLVLPPESAGSEIACRLESQTFGSKPIYEALSYTWGNDPASKAIEINGQRFQVRPNLYNALHYLRLPSAPRTIWVDAVCINQDDVQERNSQVSLMAFIYTRAERVLVWFGLAPKYGHPDPNYFSDLHYRAVSHHPYWTRLWIIQELILADSIVFHLGHIEFDWEQIFRQNPDWRAFHGRADVIKRLCEKKHTDDIRLENLIEVFQEAQCTERRDKIYGFLGLVFDGADDMIKVDYEIGFFDLYIRAMNLHQMTRPFDKQFGKEIERSVKLMKFSQLVQKVLDGAVEEDALTRSESNASKKFYTARGSLTSEILYIGPIHSHAVSSTRADRIWKQEMEETFQATRDREKLRKEYGGYHQAMLERLRKDNEAYSEAILDWDQKRLEKIRKIHTRASYGYRWNSDDTLLTINENDLPVPDVSEPRRFLGTKALIGFVPPEAMVGDFVCTFFGCDVAVVVRQVPDKGADRFMIVGRADVYKKIRFEEWAEKEAERAFKCNPHAWSKDERDNAWNNASFQGMVNLKLDVETLQKLSY